MIEISGNETQFDFPLTLDGALSAVAHAPKMDAAGEDLATVATVSTESPSPVPPPRERSAASKHYFRLESLSTLTAPVDEKTAARLARTRSVRLPENLRPPCPSSSGGNESFASGQGNGVEEEKFPIPDNPTAWARYGFLDQALLLQATGQSPGGRRAASLPGGQEAGAEAGGTESSRPLVRVRTDPSGSLRADHVERRHHPPASTIAESTAAETGSRTDGGLSLDLGTRTPPTDIMTPASEERRRAAAAAAASGVAAAGGSGGGPATAASSVSAVAARNNGPTTRRRAGGLDSMAASMLASSAAVAAAAAKREQEETKEEELVALRQQEARQATMDSVNEAAQGRSKSGSNLLRTPQTIAEIERHKRNRAERLRAYGCQR